MVHARLQIDYQGDISTLFLDDVLISDNFCNGDTWEVGLMESKDRRNVHFERSFLYIIGRSAVMALRQQYLTDWLFANGEEKACISHARLVQVPHTWSVEEKGQYIVGKGWYQTSLPAGAAVHGERVFLRFHGAYRDTEIFVNDKKAGEHRNSGYTPFTVEITRHMQFGRENVITVCVDNRFSQNALPYDRSFDWANDGGLYRPVELWVTGAVRLDDARITAQPVILSAGKRQRQGKAAFGFRVITEGAASGVSLDWALYRGAEDSVTPKESQPLLSGQFPCKAESILAPSILQDIQYWHFDRPELYTLRLCVTLPDGTLSDQREWVIGFRELKLQGETWLFNGEPVRLPGTEWMPGSAPVIGAAESKDDLEKMLRLLKASNSVLTRFHWQQDDWVYDWCDRHGLLVQEEIPYWGKQPEGDPDKLWPVVCQQLQEMIHVHGHHPSIVAWGVGNELSAHLWPIQRYVRRAVAFARKLDDSRFVNYVSNTAFGCPHQDGSGDGDIPMINDYIGTWHEGFEQESAWKSLLDAHPGRAFIPSEYGLCEPAFSGGDQRREQIFLEKMACYRAIPQIVGTIYFCLNDYRTHMGEEGEGRMKRRVHGSADLCGNPKPSYFTVQREYAPLQVERTKNGVKLSCKQDIPTYAVCGYVLKNGAETIIIPDLLPGESWIYEGRIQEASCIFRPNGDFVLNL